MTTKDILDKIQHNKYQWFDIYGLACAFNLAVSMNDTERMTEKSVITWTCTDTEVGLFAMFLDDEFVGFRQRMYRKSDDLYEWVSAEAHQKSYEYIKSLSTDDIDFGEPLIDEELIDDLLLRIRSCGSENQCYHSFKNNLI